MLQNTSNTGKLRFEAHALIDFYTPFNPYQPSVWVDMAVNCSNFNPELNPEKFQRLKKGISLRNGFESLGTPSLREIKETINYIGEAFQSTIKKKAGPEDSTFVFFFKNYLKDSKTNISFMSLAVVFRYRLQINFATSLSDFWSKHSLSFNQYNSIHMCACVPTYCATALFKPVLQLF